MPTLTLQPDAASGLDTYIRSNQATTNFGTATSMSVFRTVFLGRTDRAILEFDVSAIPVGAHVSSATLTLNVTIAVAALLNVHRLTQAGFSESQATWNVYATGQAWTTPGGDYDPTVAGTIDPLADGPVESTDLAALVQDAIENRSGRLIMLLKQANEGVDGNLQFSSSDHATAANRPELEIEYTLHASAPEGRQFDAIATLEFDAQGEGEQRRDFDATATGAKAREFDASGEGEHSREFDAQSSGGL
jgi:hypothetical protein